MDISYKWVCNSEDGYFEDSLEDHHKTFKTQEECYEDMRQAAINKVFWNTDWNDVTSDVVLDESDSDLLKTSGELKKYDDIHLKRDDETADNWGIGYRLEFHPHMIQHYSYSGLYTYKIVKIVNEPKWGEFWGGDAEYDIAQDCEEIYEKSNKKSAVLWTPFNLKNGSHVVPTDNLESRPEEYATNGYTGEFEEWGIRKTIEAIRNKNYDVESIMKYIVDNP